MANKVPSSTSIMLAVVALGYGLPLLSQTRQQPAGGTELQHRCVTVALTSDTPMLPVRLIEPYLEKRDDFQASRLLLSHDPAAADALVTLSRNGEAGTRIAAANRVTGQGVSAISGWTDHPGMVALFIMDQLRQVCPGAIVAQPKYRTAHHQCAPIPALSSLSSLSACSHTSWMDSGDIYKALESRPELKQWAVRVAPRCDDAGASLDITHNVSLTVEWFWILRSHDGNTISSGRIVAFDKRAAAAKIAAALTREIASARGADMQPVSTDGPVPGNYGKVGHTVRVLLLPTDFSVPDTRTSLFVDDERLIARDIHNRVIFDVTREQIRDARLRADWRKSFQLSDPTPLAERSEKQLQTVFVDAGLDFPLEPTVQGRSWLCRLESGFWAGVGLQAACPTLDASKFALSSAGLIGYVGAGAVLAQIPTKAEILEIAWEQNGAVKTIALQVPLLESKRLLRAVRPASDEMEQACNSPSLAATSQR